jgi:hypothetical protein
MHHDSEIAASSLFITIKQFTQQRSKGIAGVIMFPVGKKTTT